MKKSKKITLIVLAAVLLILGAVTVWQWKNIKALSMALRYSDSELEEMMKDNEALMDDAMDKLPDVSFTPLTEEERKKLRDGELSEEEAISIITGSNPNSGSIGTQMPEDKELESKKARVTELVAAIYVMRDTFTSSLEKIKDAAVIEYRSLPEEERTSTVKTEMMFRCLDQAVALESECDATVTAILKELEQVLTEIDGDLSLVKDIKAIYANEKAAKKAYYLNLYS